MSPSLEPDGSAMRAMAEACLERVVAHLETLPRQPSHGLEAADDHAAGLREGPPVGAAGLDDLLRVVFEAVPFSLNTAGPGYLAYIPGGGLFTAALADFVASAVNRYVGIWGAAPALAQLELNVVRWLCDWMGYPVEAMGVLTSGGSLANFAAVVTAREWWRNRGDRGSGDASQAFGRAVADTGDLPRDRGVVPSFPRSVPAVSTATLYVSADAHHSIAKAAHLAGFPRNAVRVVPVDAGRCMVVAALEEMVRADRAAGRTPFLVAGNAGTTSTGAVDPLDALADVARAEGLWLHVDAAYGGFFMLTERGRRALRGIERADSIVLDPHKGLFLPYGTGCVLVRDGRLLREAHAADAEYLQDLGEGISFADYSAEQSRDFRGLRVWLPLKLHGIEAFRAALDEKLDLAGHAWERLRDAGFEMLPRPELSIAAFRWIPRDGDAEVFNAELMRRVNAEKRVMLSSTVLDRRYVVRICALSFRTHRDRVDEAVDALIRNAREMEEGSPRGRSKHAAPSPG